MPLRIPIGLDDFRTLREQRLEYIDKSDLIRQLLDRPGVEVALLPRPRRFGKTLNLSMLRCYFEKRDEDLSHLFQDLSIWQAGDEYRAQFQRYPVIHFNFKGVRGESFDDCWGAIRKNIQVLFGVQRRCMRSPWHSMAKRCGCGASRRLSSDSARKGVTAPLSSVTLAA
jgi:hypothetical protein